MIDGEWAIYFCTACNRNVADPRGWPAHDCHLCGAGAERLEEEHKPSIKAAEAVRPESKCGWCGKSISASATHCSQRCWSMEQDPADHV